MKIEKLKSVHTFRHKWIRIGDVSSVQGLEPLHCWICASTMAPKVNTRAEAFENGK
jgi:hypothetical protein